MTFLRRVTLTFVGFAMLVLTGSAGADDYPSKPIRFVIATAPGGIIDLVSRLVGERLTEAWGQQVLMDHRPGASGLIGTEFAAKAEPDGHTLIVGYLGPHAILPGLPALAGKINYDPIKSFAPVTLAVTLPNVVVVHPSVQANSIQELIALCKARPGQINFASSGIGTGIHLAGEMFKMMTGVDMVHIIYKGSAPALTDLVGGRVQIMFSNITPALPFIKAGRLRALGVTSATRTAIAPDLPTVAESGVPGYDVTSWVGFWAPAAPPKNIITRLNTEIFKALKNPRVRDALLAQGADPVPMSPEQLDDFLKAEITKWATVLKAAKIDKM